MLIETGIYSFKKKWLCEMPKIGRNFSRYEPYPQEN